VGGARHTSRGERRGGREKRREREEERERPARLAPSSPSILYFFLSLFLSSSLSLSLCLSAGRTLSLAQDRVCCLARAIHPSIIVRKHEEINYYLVSMRARIYLALIVT